MIAAAARSVIILETRDIENTAARDIYDILSLVPELQGISYGITGQPVYFRSADRSSFAISLYIDDIPYGKNITDISFLPVGTISSIVIDDRSVENQGISLYIYTKNNNPEVPVTQIDYKDAFFNYRDLSASISQKYSNDVSFYITGSLLDWKDKRESTDIFRYPYQRQSHSAKIKMPEIFSMKPEFIASYTKENKFRLDTDSSYVKDYSLVTSLTLDKKLSGKSSNRITAVNRFENGKSEDLLFKNKFSAGDSIRSYSASGEVILDNDGPTGAGLRTDLSALSFVDYSLTGYLGTANGDNTDFSLHGGLKKDLGGLVKLSSSHSYSHFRTDNNENTAIFRNCFYAGRTFGSGDLTLSVGAGINMTSYPEYPDGYETGRRDYLKHEAGIAWKKLFRLRSSGITLISEKFSGSMISNNVTSADFSERYFKEKLGINISIYHKYAHYLLGTRGEFHNNLGFNLTARISDLEFYFGADNFLKDKYSFGDEFFEVNPHYSYSTTGGFDMRSRDEIWGIRWIFYR
jgi:hypothetical protein